MLVLRRATKSSTSAAKGMAAIALVCALTEASTVAAPSSTMSTAVAATTAVRVAAPSLLNTSYGPAVDPAAASAETMASERAAADRAKAALISAQLQAEGLLLAKLAERADAESVKSQQLDRQLRATQSASATASNHVRSSRALLVEQAVAAYTEGGAFSYTPGTVRGTGLAVAATYAELFARDQRVVMNEYEAAIARDRVIFSDLLHQRASVRAAARQLAMDRTAASAQQTALGRTLAGVRGDLAEAVAEAETQQEALQAAQEKAYLASIDQLPAQRAAASLVSTGSRASTADGAAPGERAGRIADGRESTGAVRTTAEGMASRPTELATAAATSSRPPATTAPSTAASAVPGALPTFGSAPTRGPAQVVPSSPSSSASPTTATTPSSTTDRPVTSTTLSPPTTATYATAPSTTASSATSTTALPASSTTAAPLSAASASSTTALPDSSSAAQPISSTAAPLLTSVTSASDMSASTTSSPSTAGPPSTTGPPSTSGSSLGSGTTTPAAAVTTTVSTEVTSRSLGSTTTAAPGTGRGDVGSGTGVTTLAPTPSTTTAPVAPVPNTEAPGAQTALAFAESQIGKPYQWGGAGPARYDCSGLTMVAWEKAGVSMPHSAQDQYDLTTRIPISALLPGDLVFFGTPTDVYHVGIYVGGGSMVDAPETGQDVGIQPIYELNLLGGGRIR